MRCKQNESMKQLDDLMLHCWENEGGSLGPLPNTDGPSHRAVMSREMGDAMARAGSRVDQQGKRDLRFPAQSHCRHYRREQHVPSTSYASWRGPQIRRSAQAALP